MARKLHANPRVLAVVGPAGSQEVLAVGPVFREPDRLPFISGSATRAALTNGSIPNFFRVAPKDSSQAPTIASYIRRVLKPRRVVVVDDRSAYSRPLANEVQASLTAAGVRVIRRSVDAKVTDFSSLAATIGPTVDVVFVPWQFAANAQLLGRELKARGRRAILFGSDALDSGDFTIAGAYVSSFAPDIRGIAGNAGFLEAYRAPFLSRFGPPAYVATQAAVTAIRKACADGRANRAEVLRHLSATFLPRTVLGASLRFTPRGDRKGARFSIFKLGASGKQTMVAR